MRRTALLALAPVLAVAVACGGSSSPSTTSELPTASGSYGEKPAIEFPDGKPDGELHTKVLEEGDGAVVHKGDLLAFDYLGQIWDGKVFDNSYDRKVPLVQQVGAGMLIPSWDSELPGKTVGSRILLSVPPKDGYGPQGNPNINVKGTDTLVFVVDLIATYPKDVGGDPHATVAASPPKGMTVKGRLGKPATVEIGNGAKPPTKPKVVVLAKGKGDPVRPGTVVVQYVATDWTGKQLQSTWKAGHPTSANVGYLSAPTPVDGLVGVPLGSRVLVLIPPQDGKQAKAKSVAILFDLVAQPGTAADAKLIKQ